MPRGKRDTPEAKTKLRPIDPTSGVPRSVQAMRSLLTAISSGELGPMLPNQHEIASQLGTSLSTVRQAIDMLRAEGRVIAVPSVGTFVRQVETDRDVPPVSVRPGTSLTALAVPSVRSTLMASEQREAPKRAGALAGQTCQYWQWRLVGPELEPSALVEAWATKRFAEGASRANSPFDLLAASRGRLQRLDEMARTVAPLPTERRLLSLESSTGVMLVTSAGYGSRGEQVLYMEWVMGPNMGLTLSLRWGDET
jgi:DNA-binding GntR family transcriptional regulator